MSVRHTLCSVSLRVAAPLLLSLVVPAVVRRVTVWLRSGQATNALERPNVKVEKIENNMLIFRSAQSDRVTERALEDVVRITADGEPMLNAAEEALAAGDWDKGAPK